MDTRSPVVNRRSRKIAPVDRTDEGIANEDLLNLEDERLRSRQIAENEFQNITNADKRLSISDKSITEHFQSCIQLAAENKINPKNAFNFKLIDLLYTMFSKKKPIKDFTEVSSSLDAGVKIYSCRVDNVHSDTLKMATSVSSGNKAKDEDEAEEQDTVVGRKRKTIRKTKKTTIAPAKEINRARVNDHQNNYYSVSTKDNFITSSAIFDSSKMCLHLNSSQNFWQSEKPVSFSHENISINFPCLSDDACICTTFKNFKFGDEITTAESFVPEKGPAYSASSGPFQMDFKPSNDEPVYDDCTFQNDNHEEDFEAPSRESENHVACLSKMMSSSDFVMEISNLITSENSDYRYFNFQKLQKKIHSRNTQHWIPLRQKSMREKRVKDEKKETINFENVNEKSDDLKIFDKESDPACTFNTTASREKFLVTPVTDFSVNKFFKLNVWRDMFIIPNADNVDESPSELEEMIEDYDYNNPNDSQNFLPDHHEDDYDDEQENELNEFPADVHEAIEKTMLLKDNLVEIPNKVSKIQLPYLVEDKSVNMKELKSKIWHEIEFVETEVESKPIHETQTFKNIYNELMDQEKNSKKDLSIPIVFNAILQLANDKNLSFDSNGQLTDFIVSVDTEKVSTNSF